MLMSFNNTEARGNVPRKLSSTSPIATFPFSFLLMPSVTCFIIDFLLAEMYANAIMYKISRVPTNMPKTLSVFFRCRFKESI